MNPNPLELAQNRFQQAAGLERLGRYADAEPLYCEALSFQEEVLGSHHPEVATTLNMLAELLRQNGDYVAAEACCRRSLAIREEHFGTNHPETATSCHTLGLILTQRGN